MKWAVTTLVVCVALLLALGMVVLYSAKMTQGGAHYLVMQLSWAGFGLLACLAAAVLDYGSLRKVAWPLLAVSVLLLVLVLVPGIGLKINGARRWFDFRVMRFQPSELAKIALIIAIAFYAERRQRQMQTFKHGLLTPGLFIGVTLALILKEPDFGTTILMAGVSSVMLLIAGLRWRIVLPPVVIGATALTILIARDPVRMERVNAWLNPEAYRETVGYQPWQAMLALGSGGPTGLGLGNSRQKLGFVPEHHTDFILAVVGEEFGLVGSLGVLTAFILIVGCGIYIAWRARDTFGQLLAAGITFLIGFQAAINIGVVTSALPNKGLPLPFISYGGSNLLVMLAGVGLLLSVARQVVETPEPVLAAAGKNPFAPART